MLLSCFCSEFSIFRIILVLCMRQGCDPHFVSVAVTQAISFFWWFYYNSIINPYTNSHIVRIKLSVWINQVTEVNISCNMCICALNAINRFISCFNILNVGSQTSMLTINNYNIWNCIIELSVHCSYVL